MIISKRNEQWFLSGLILLAYLDGNPPLRHVFSIFPPYPFFKSFRRERKGKMREKKGVVTGESPPSHHHDGHHLRCFCFLWGTTSFPLSTNLHFSL
ncbi:hypothetical protein Hdeb2414_s0001g00033491 [Helianthus debilis subsp. tardiflorus]